MSYLLLSIALIVIFVCIVAILNNPVKFLYDAEFKTQLSNEELEEFEIK